MDSSAAERTTRRGRPPAASREQVLDAATDRSGAGNVQRRNVAMITAVIEEEVEAGRYDPPVEASTLGYAVVLLAEAFIFNESATAMVDSVDRLREVEVALLGVKA